MKVEFLRQCNQNLQARDQFTVHAHSSALVIGACVAPDLPLRRHWEYPNISFFGATTRVHAPLSWPAGRIMLVAVRADGDADEPPDIWNGPGVDEGRLEQADARVATHALQLANAARTAAWPAGSDYTQFVAQTAQALRNGLSAAVLDASLKGRSDHTRLALTAHHIGASVPTMSPRAVLHLAATAIAIDQAFDQFLTTLKAYHNSPPSIFVLPPRS